MLHSGVLLHTYEEWGTQRASNRLSNARRIGTIRYLQSSFSGSNPEQYKIFLIRKTANQISQTTTKPIKTIFMDGTKWKVIFIPLQLLQNRSWRKNDLVPNIMATKNADQFGFGNQSWVEKKIAYKLIAGPIVSKPSHYLLLGTNKCSTKRDYCDMRRGTWGIRCIIAKKNRNRNSVLWQRIFNGAWYLKPIGVLNFSRQ